MASKYNTLSEAIKKRTPEGYRCVSIMVDPYGFKSSKHSEAEYIELLAKGINEGVDVDLKSFRDA